MFSTVGAATQSSSPAANPFAPKPQPTASNPFASVTTTSASVPNQNKAKGRSLDHSDNEGKRKGFKSFKDKEADLSDSSSKSKGKKPFERKSNGQNEGFSNKRPHKTTFGSAGPPTSGPLNSAPPTNSDPHARKVYTQLHKDGISPPNWPSKPGETSSSGAMSAFREKYETYREQVRKSLTKAGIIDDPNKRRALKDAIDFRGICEDMCPEFEKIERITEQGVQGPEKDENDVPQTSRMIKKLARSAAGQDAPLPMDVRSVPCLKRTIDYLVDGLLQDDENLPGYHAFIWDRTRAIRRDFAFFSTTTPEEIKMQVYVLENIARFHVTALHLLSQKGKKPEHFSEQQELEQLGKTLLSLRDLYDDCNAQNIVCENEVQFRAYYLVFHAEDEGIIETLQRSWKPSLWKDSDEVRTAVSLVEALQNMKGFHGKFSAGPTHAASGAHLAYFRIVEDPSVSYTMACFAECHFAALRRSILSSVTRALARPSGVAKDVTAAALNRFLRFDTIDEAIEFAERHELEFEADEEAPNDPDRFRLCLRRQQLPHIRLTHQYSSMVERKRGSHTLPDCVHNTVLADPNSRPPQQPAAKSGLFAPASKPAPATTPFGAAPNATQSPFSAFAQPPKGPSGLSNGVAANESSQAKPNPFGSLSNQSTLPGANPPSTGFKPSPIPPATNPFGNLSQPATGGTGSTGPQATTQPSQPSASEPTKASPFGGFSQPQTSGSILGSGFPMTSGQTEPASKPTTQQGLGESNPSPFGFPKPAPQQASVTAAATAGPSLLPAAAPEKSTQPTPGLPSFPQTNSKDTSSIFPSGQTFTNTEAPTNTLSPSLLPPSDTTNKGMAKSVGFDFSRNQTIEVTPATSSKTSASLAPAAPPAPPRDLMKDFTNWFANGDGGIIEDFKVYMVDNILREAFEEWSIEEEERKRKEEEDRINEEVETFRVYNLRVKFFYRWRNNARAKRLRFLRKSGREQVRAYHAAKREEEREAARKAAEEKAQVVKPDRGKEMTELLQRTKRSRRSRDQEDLLASGVLSGLGNERHHAARIVRRENHQLERPNTSASSRPSSSGSTTRSRGGKTQAIREQLLLKKTGGFRKSLPSTAITRSEASPEPSRHVSNVSERWRLKAMGIVQMPDGTALPENMANDILYGGKRYPGLEPRPRASSYSASERMPPPTSVARRDASSQLSRIYGSEEPTATNKRKRVGDEDVEETDGRGDASPHKRVMSENQKLISELRAMREELEEGTSWFRSQNERLQSEIQSRGTTPWDDSI